MIAALTTILLCQLAGEALQSCGKDRVQRHRCLDACVESQLQGCGAAGVRGVAGTLAKEGPAAPVTVLSWGGR